MAIQVPPDRQPYPNGDSTCSVPLTHGYVAIIDESDIQMVAGRFWFARGRSDMYAMTRCGKTKRLIYMHHVILGVQCEVDHINNNTLDNRRSNLRICTRSQNNANRSVICGAVPFKGVSLKIDSTGRPRYIAKVTHKRKTVHYSTHDSAVEAAMVYDIHASRVYRDFACTNADLGLLEGAVSA